MPEVLEPPVQSAPIARRYWDQAADLLHAPALGDRALHTENNFQVLRLMAALMVMFSHQFGIGRPGLVTEPFYLLTGGREDAGSLAVEIFFVTSGFLVSQSFERSRNVWQYAASRVLRIFPGLIVAVTASIFLAGLASAVPWKAFLTDPMTVNFWLSNVRLWGLKFILPGAFLTSPLTAVNGSLWTLPTEGELYVGCGVIGLLGLLQSRAAFNAFGLGMYIFLLSGPNHLLGFMANYSRIQWTAAFLMGMLLYVNRRQVRLSFLLLALGLWLSTFSHDHDLGRIYVAPVVAYAVIVFALHPRLYWPWPSRLGDYSYGIYLYAFPIQQLVGYYIPGVSFWLGLAISIPITLMLAILSWHFVEKPALSLKRFMPRRPPAPAVA